VHAAERVERFEHHEIERPLEYVGFLLRHRLLARRPAPLLLFINRTVPLFVLDVNRRQKVAVNYFQSMAYWGVMERLSQDLRFALRLLLKDRTFTAATLLTLAVCIGANATIFAVVNSVLLRPLEMPEPDRLVLLFNSYPRAGVERASNGVPDYFDRRKEIDAFEEVALYNTRGLTIGIEGNPQRVTGMAATPSLLRMLAARPIEGRIFTDAEGERGSDTKAVLSYSFWQELYGGASAVVGSQLRVNGVPHTIVGILPPDFLFLNPTVKVWLPLSFTPEEKSDDARHSNNWSMIARLRPGATIAQAQQQVDALNARNLERFADLRKILINAGFHTVVTPLQDDLVRGVRPTLYLLWGGVVFMLLIGVVNITNLALARSSGRARELATRQALGAGMSRLVRQLLTETVLLTIAGGAIGAALGYWGVSALKGLGLERLPRGHEVTLDGDVVAFTLALAVAVGIVVALVPVLSVRHINLSQAFREEGRSGTAGRGTRTVRRVLVIAQVGIAFMLLIGAALLLASFQRVIGIDPGFQPSHVLTARVALPAVRYPGDPEVNTFISRFLDRVRALPGVQFAGVTSNVPFGGDYSDSVILAEGYRMAPGESLISPFRVSVTPGYFEAMGIAIRRGRNFTESDTASSPGVVIVDEKLARRFWGDADPVGRRMYQPDNPEDLTKPGPNARWYTVAGVVSEIRMSGLIETDDRFGAYYLPMQRRPSRSLTLTVKTGVELTTLTPALRRELAAIDGELPLYGVMPMQQRVDDSLVDRRTPMLLSTMFAAVALFLAALGIYGVLAYQVAQRRREIGIRLALGSDSSAIFRLVLSEGMLLLVLGLAAGLTGAFAIRRALEAQLYGVGAMDPVILGAVSVVLCLVALIACAVPARRASRIDPVAALVD
jgi:predicted permease